MKKILAVLVALVVMLSTVSAFAYTYDPTGYNYYNNNYNNYNNYGYNNYGYGYNNGYNGYGYCTGMRMNYNDAEYQPSYWFNTYAEQYGIGFKLGNTELRDKVNESLHKLKEDGTFDKLAEKYGLSDMICLE